MLPLKLLNISFGYLLDIVRFLMGKLNSKSACIFGL